MLDLATWQICVRVHVGIGFPTSGNHGNTWPLDETVYAIYARALIGYHICRNVSILVDFLHLEWKVCLLW